MAMPRKLFNVSMLIDHSVLHDLLSLAAGKSFKVEVHPVKHGGVDEETGSLKSAPSAPEFVAAYAARHAAFTSADAVTAGAPLGVNKNSIQTAIYKLEKTGVLKKTGPGAWKVTGKGYEPTQRGRQKGSKAPGPGERTSDKILAALKANGGEASIAMIKTELKKHGRAPTGVSPTITKMVRTKEIVRIGPATYRINATAAH